MLQKATVSETGNVHDRRIRRYKMQKYLFENVHRKYHGGYKIV